MTNPSDIYQNLSSEDAAAIRALLQQDAMTAQASLVNGGQGAVVGPQDSAGLAGVTPQLLAELQGYPVVHAPPKKQMEPWHWMGISAMGCLTVLGVAYMVAASMPGARGTAEVNTALMVAGAAVESMERPSVTCIGFGCGRFGEAIAASQKPSPQPVAVAPLPNPSSEVGTPDYNERLARAKRVDLLRMNLEAEPPGPRRDAIQAELNRLLGGH